ncbi:MAG: glycosyltransferase [Flavobacteriales bacterium]
MNRPKILHITPWYTNEAEPTRGIFIKRHIDGLTAHCDNHVLYVNYETPHLGELRTDTITRINACAGWKNWRWQEWVFHMTLMRGLKELDALNRFTHVVFHIAYPALVYFQKLRPMLPSHICITEHWSIYHFNFFTSKKPHRLMAIFSHNLKLICVSEALGRSIQSFTQQLTPYQVIPNVVPETFYCHNKPRGRHFFTAAFWKQPKEPMQLFGAIKTMKQKGKAMTLRVAGSGPLLKVMQQFVLENDLNNEIQLLGYLNELQLAEAMNEAMAFVLPTSFETFSAVCAEALCCGCPVLANDVGALGELINESNGRLLQTTEGWEHALESLEAGCFDNVRIAADAQSRFYAHAIGPKYFQTITQS